MAKTYPFTQDEALRPVKMTCVNCKAEMTVYPYPMPTGSGYCPNCSPLWLENFLKFATNNLRKERGLEPLFVSPELEN